MAYVLDTNVLSETRKRRRDRGLSEWIEAMPAERLYLSAMTIGEIGRGITQVFERGDRRQAALLEGWLDGIIDQFDLRIAPVTVDVAREWAAQSQVQPIPVVDGLIAATAKAHGWTLVTRNTKDFERTGVRLLNPFTG